MTHKNNHARSKRKRKMLRLKNFIKSVWEKRFAKKKKAAQPKGKSIQGIAINHALDFTGERRFLLSGELMDHTRCMHLNQRQKRKIAKHANKY